MKLDSAEFLLFLAGVLLLDRTRLRGPGLLICATYLFYAASDSGWSFLPLLIASTTLDFMLGRALERTRYAPRRRALLFVSVFANLGTLAYFKYARLVLDALTAVGLADSSPRLAAPIPLGISFFTFQKLGYVIDVYRKQIAAARRPLDFALFVTFFPQLTAGPILRADRMLPQIARRPRANARQALNGLELCLVGWFKKIVLAEAFAQPVNECFSQPVRYSGAALIVASLAFSAQLFCDFSAYTTIARGIGKLLGYELPENFGFPLLARNPIEYRRDWHITMGDWFRDYLYRPLGGDRGGVARMVVNTLFTWSAFGLWHGPTWSYLAWGFFNGLLLSAYRLGRGARLWVRLGWLGPALLYPLMPLFLVLTNVLFRAPDLSAASTMYLRILSLAPGADIPALWLPVLLAALATHALSRRFYHEDVLTRVGQPMRVALTAVMLVAIYLFGQPGRAFYYRQF